VRDLDEEEFVGKLMKEKTDLRTTGGEAILKRTILILYVHLDRVRDLDEEGFV
jgi:hypothetical protein